MAHMETYTARAHTNIALLKYWGKADTTYMVPTTTSISLTLDEFYTDTTVTFDDSLSKDVIYLNDMALSGKSADKVSRVLDLVRQTADINTYARVTSINHVPTAAGLASSASAFAALAGAATHAAGLTPTLADISRLARRGSGSASRSVFGGFVKWERGIDDLTSVAEPLFETVDWPIQLITVILNDQPKAIDSRSGMQHAQATSPFYNSWVDRTNAQTNEMISALSNHDINAVGEMAEQNALEMHATNATAQPPFNYLTDRSWGVLAVVQQLRAAGVAVYATMDAGPNVKLISDPKDTDQILAALHAWQPDVTTQVATPGPGIKIQKGHHII